MPVPSFLSGSRWSGLVFATLALAACGNHANGVAGSGRNSGTSSGVGTSAGTGTGVSAGVGVGSGSASAGGSGSGASTGTGSGSTSGAVSGASTGTGSGSTSGTTSGASTGTTSGATGASSGVVFIPPTFKVYEVTGNWPALQPVVATKPPTMPFVYKKITVGGALGTQFLAESCSIADYNGDGIPDVSAGRRWYEGPDFQKAHIFRGTPFTTPGHGSLPRFGASGGGGPTSPTAEYYNGVSDDTADWPWDMDGDGWPDIINVASPDFNTIDSPEPKPQTNATIYWYKNPGMPSVAGDFGWVPNLISADMRLEHHNLCDFDGDGRPEITGACKSCGQTKGIYKADRAHPTNAWTYYPTTRTYFFPFNGTGLMHGLGAGDVDGDGKPDLIDRSGVWLQPATGAFATPPPAETCNGMACTPWQWVPQAFSVPADLGNGGNDGSATMFAYDVDGDGDMDIIGSDWAHGIGLSWYEQTAPIKSCIGTTNSCFAKHQIMGMAPDMYSATVGGTQVVTTENHAAQMMDMDGDGLADIITGKNWLACPYDCGDPDSHSPPYLFIFKLVRDANPPQSGKAHFEAHMIDPTCNTTCWGQGTGPGGTTSLTPCCSGVGRQIAIGQINPQTDGIMDICIASKLGLYVYLGQ